MHFLNGVVQAISETFDLPEPVLEIGSYLTPGREEIANLRQFFTGKSYVGIDIRPGPGVDQVADVECLPHADGSVGTVLCLSTLEHVQRFWRAFDELHRVLRPDGVLVISVPFNIRIHNHPSDYWRFTPEAVDLLLEDYPSRLIGWHGPVERPENIWAVAFREARPAITEAQFRDYERLVQRYARQPLPLRRKVRYRLIEWINGHRLCAPFLEQEKCETYLRSDARALAG
jgi:SAM-dependent methyltransferase